MATPDARPAPPSRRQDLVERLWDLASDPRAAAAVAAALLLAWGAASLLAPTEAPGTGAARPAGGFLELDDPLHAWWLTLLPAALVLCLLALAADRLPRAILAVLRPSRRLTAPVERGLRRVRRLPGGADARAEAARVAAAFRARGFEPETAEEGKSLYLFAQRGRRGRAGEWVVLAGLLWLAGAGLAGQLLGWEGTAVVQEGESIAEVSRRAGGGLSARQPLPFAARVNRFEVDAGRPGAPGGLRAEVSLLGAGGGEVLRQVLDGRRPMRRSGIDLDLAGWSEVPGGPRASLVLIDRETQARRPLRVGRGEPVQAGTATFSIEDYTPAFRELGPAVRVRRTEGGRSTEFWVFQAHPDFDARNRPDRWSLEFGGLRKSYAATLRVAYRPMTEALAAGAALVLLGLLLALSAAHRRLWARVEPGAVVLAGASHRRGEAMERTLDEVGRSLGTGGGA